MAIPGSQNKERFIAEAFELRQMRRIQTVFDGPAMQAVLLCKGRQIGMPRTDHVFSVEGRRLQRAHEFAHTSVSASHRMQTDAYRIGDSQRAASSIVMPLRLA